ncbi:hypothetical protein JOD54_003611 [Actinokineospora baliensis]|nr:hypothetical protein [Actinokineospora baliensis]
MATQVEEELPVGEAVGDAVRPLHGERRLAHARGGGDHHDRSFVGARQQGVQCGQLARTTGEVPDPGGQLCRAARGGPGVQVGVAAQDGGVQVDQLAAGVDTELLGQPGAQGAEDAECVGVLAAPVQGQHAQPGQPLAGRMRGDQPGQLPGRLGVPTQTQLGVPQVFHRREPQLVQGVDLAAAPALQRGVGEGVPAPQRQRLAQQRRGGLGAVPTQVLAGRADQPLEAQRVDHLGFDFEQVAGLPGAQDGREAAGGERLPDPGDVAVQGLDRGARRVLPPQHVDQPGSGQHGPGVQGQHAQHGPLAGAVHQRAPGRADGLDRTQHTQLAGSGHAQLLPRRSVKGA